MANTITNFLVGIGFDYDAGPVVPRLPHGSAAGSTPYFDYNVQVIPPSSSHTSRLQAAARAQRLRDRRTPVPVVSATLAVSSASHASAPGESTTRAVLTASDASVFSFDYTSGFDCFRCIPLPLKFRLLPMHLFP